MAKTHANRQNGKTFCGRKLKGLSIDDKFPSCKACQKAETAYQRKLDESRDREWAQGTRQAWRDRQGG
jgi:hypothetical protein